MTRPDAVDLAEPVAATIDVDDVPVVNQAVEDRGGEDLRPVSHVLVGGEHDGAALEACAHPLGS